MDQRPQLVSARDLRDYDDRPANPRRGDLDDDRYTGGLRIGLAGLALLAAIDGRPRAAAQRVTSEQTVR